MLNFSKQYFRKVAHKTKAYHRETKKKLDITFTKVPVGVFDSSIQFEVVMFELRGQSVAMVSPQFEAENGNDNDSFKLPIFLRFGASKSHVNGQQMYIHRL
jgi:hypothetical protein